MPKMKSTNTANTQPAKLYQELRQKNPEKVWGGILHSSEKTQCIFETKGYVFPIIKTKMELSCPEKGLHLCFASVEPSKKEPETDDEVPESVAIIAITMPSSKCPKLLIYWGADITYEFGPEDNLKFRLQIVGDASKYNFPKKITTMQFFFYLSTSDEKKPIIYYGHEHDPACLLLNHSFFSKEVANDSTK